MNGTASAEPVFYSVGDIVELTAPSHKGLVFKVVNYARSDKYPYIIEGEDGSQLKANPKIMRKVDRPFTGITRATMHLGTVVRFTTGTGNKAGLFVVIKNGAQPNTYNVTRLGGGDVDRCWRSVDAKNLTVVQVADLPAEIAKG